VGVRSFKDLVVWHRARGLAEEIYRLAAELPRDERFGLAGQLKRAAVSVPSNIAEGYSRQSTGDYRHHLQIARGSLGELETQLLLAARLRLLDSTDAALGDVDECSRMLNAMIRQLRREASGLRREVRGARIDRHFTPSSFLKPRAY